MAISLTLAILGNVCVCSFDGLVYDPLSDGVWYDLIDRR